MPTPAGAKPLLEQIKFKTLPTALHGGNAQFCRIAKLRFAFRQNQQGKAQDGPQLIPPTRAGRAVLFAPQEYFIRV